MKRFDKNGSVVMVVEVQCLFYVTFDCSNVPRKLIVERV